MTENIINIITTTNIIIVGRRFSDVDGNVLEVVVMLFDDEKKRKLLRLQLSPV